MKTMILYNRPWFESFLFEPVVKNPDGNDEIAKNISKTPYAYNLTFQTPGFARRDLKITVEDQELIVVGDKKVKRGGLFRKNREDFESYFINKTAISNDMDVDKIKARFKNEELSIEIPKKKEFINYREIPVIGNSDLSKETAKEQVNPANKWGDLKRKIQLFWKKAA